MLGILSLLIPVLMPLPIDSFGMIFATRILPMRFLTLERGPIHTVRGIVIHQTDAQTASATLHSYRRKGTDGAHFLIDKDGAIYQTASVRQATQHIGFIKPRCIAAMTCSPVAYRGVRLGQDTHRIEMRKSWPVRYPTNREAIGIELVGRATLPAGFKPRNARERGMTMEQLRGEAGVYEAPTALQNLSLKWLVDELIGTLKVSSSEVFRHPVVSWKNPDEARRATW